MLNDILYYGADPTGNSDTTPAVQASIADQKYVDFRVPGEFRFNTPCDIDEACLIEGLGSARIVHYPAIADLKAGNDTVDVFRVNANSVTMRGINVLGTPGRMAQGMGRGIVVGPNGPVENFRLLDSSLAQHSKAVHLVNGSNFWVERNTLHGFYSLTLENQANSDKGDGNIRDNEFFCNGQSGTRCVYWKSGGSPMFSGNKYLDCQDGIVVEVGGGMTGGPVFTHESIENFTRYGLYAYGDANTTLHGLSLSGGWINGGAKLIFIADNAVIDKLQIGPFMGATTGGLMYIGANCRSIGIIPGSLDAGGGTGIGIADGATGFCSEKGIHNVGTGDPVNNYSIPGVEVY